MKEITRQELENIFFSEDFEFKCLIMVKTSDSSTKEYEIFVNDASRKKLHRSFIGKLVVLKDNFEINYVTMPYSLDRFKIGYSDEFYLEDNMYRAIRDLKFLGTLS